MSHILGLKFRDSGPIYYFDSGAFVVDTFDRVIVNTDQGMALAKVVLVLDEPPDDFEGGEIKPIYRLATEEDMAQEKENEELGREAFEYCRTCITEHKLDMKLVDVDVFFDRGKIVFYFTAPNRIDFRELVKDLVRTYRTRIELRQIGVRHETQMTGAVGNCGQLCCCRRFLRKFAPVTIKMAKEQNLFLNPTKISGICGRLLCCLAYEQENYEKFHAKCPRVGKRYVTERGGMKVLRANFFRDSLSILPDGGEEEEIAIDDWEELAPQRPDPNQQQQQQRPETKPKKDKPRKPKGRQEDEATPSQEVEEAAEESKPEEAVEESKAEPAESGQPKPEKKKRDQKRGRRGSKGRKRDKDGDQQQDESPKQRQADKDSGRREQTDDAAMPAGEVVRSQDSDSGEAPTQNLPAVKTKGTFGISGIGAQPAQEKKEKGKAPSEEKAPAEQQETKEQQQDGEAGDKAAQDASQKPKGKGRSRSSRRRPSRRSGRGRGKKGGDSGSQDSGGSSEANDSGGQDTSKSGAPGESGKSGSEKPGSGQRKSRPRRRRRKPKQDKPKE